MDQLLQFMQSVHYENPHFIWWRSPVSFGCFLLLALCAATTITWWLWYRGRVQAVKGYGSIDLVTRWTALPHFGIAVVTLVCLLGIFTLGLTSATMPYQSLGAVSVPSGTLRIFSLFDGSRSMGAENRDDPKLYGGRSCTMVEGPCGRRIEIARLIMANQIIPAIRGNQVGVVVYSGTAVTKSDLTNDLQPIETMLTTGWIDVGTALGEGTYLHEAINAAVKGFEAHPAKFGESNVILLFTDGESHSKPEELAAALEGVKRVGALLVVVGIGSTEPAYIPLYDGQGKPMYDKEGKRMYHTFADGKVAETARNDAFLEELVASVGGRYIIAEPGKALNINWPTSLAGSRVEIAKKYLYPPLIAGMLVLLGLVWLAGTAESMIQRARNSAKSR